MTKSSAVQQTSEGQEERSWRHLLTLLTLQGKGGPRNFHVIHVNNDGIDSAFYLLLRCGQASRNLNHLSCNSDLFILDALSRSIRSITPSLTMSQNTSSSTPGSSVSCKISLLFCATPNQPMMRRLHVLSLSLSYKFTYKKEQRCF